MYQVDKVADTLREAFKGAQCPGLFLYINANTISDESRNIVRFGGDRRPSVTNLETMDIVVFYGMAHSVENLLQGGGRAARDPTSQVWCSTIRLFHVLRY